MEYYKILSIVLTDDISFEDITNKIAIAFNIKLQTVNDDGRLLSVGETEKYKVIVIDRYDDLSDLLCDENYVLDIDLHQEIFQEKEILEEEIISILKCNKISWEREEYGLHGLQEISLTVIGKFSQKTKSSEQVGWAKTQPNCKVF